MFKLKFLTGNDAFQCDAGELEMARILRDVADKVASGVKGGLIRDINGNKVGDWEVMPR